MFQLLVSSVQDYAIFMLDPWGRIASWNEGAARIKGYAAQEIIGQHFSVFYPERDVSAGKPEWELIVAADTGRYEDEGWRVRKDGNQFWANVVITALRDESGNLKGFGKVTRDLTSRRRAELERVERERKEADLLPSRNSLHAFPPALRLLAAGVIDARFLITHRFPLTEAGQALDALDEEPGTVLKALIEAR